MKPRTFVMIRHDGLPYRSEILRRLGEVATVVASRSYEKGLRAVFEEIYKEHRGEFFYHVLVGHHVGKPGEFLILEANGGEEKEDRVARFFEAIDKLVGVRDPAKAAEGTIRGDLSDDSIEDAIERGEMVYNRIHRSRTPLDAIREAGVVFYKPLYEIANLSRV